MAEPVRARRLSDEEGRRLLQIVRRGKHGSVRVRRAMIIMGSASGTRVPAIARLVAADEDTVRDVIQAFNARGLAALDPRWAGGRPRLISDEDTEVIVAAARTRPEKLGQPFTHWSLRKLAGYLARRDRPVRIGRERLRQILHARGISFQRTRTWKESTDPDKDAKLDRIEYVTSRYPDRCFAFDQFGPLSIRPCHGVCWAPRTAFQSIHRSSCPAAARRHFRPLRSEAEPHWYGSIQWVLELLRREGSEVPLGLAVHGLHRASRERDKRGAPVLCAGEDQGTRWPEHASGSPPRTLGTR